MARGRAGARVNGRAGALIGLHVLLLVYSLSGFFSKNAAAAPVLSPQFMFLYGGMLAILFGYALGWQQVIKRLPLTLAFANKAVTVIWGMVWGALFFGEAITPPMVAGAALVIAGVVLYAVADGEDAQAAQAQAADGPANGAGESCADPVQAASTAGKSLADLSPCEPQAGDRP